MRSLIRQGHTHEESSCYYGGQNSGLRGLTRRSFGTVYAGHASPKKHRAVYNFLSFYSVILKLGTKKELVIHF